MGHAKLVNHHILKVIFPIKFTMIYCIPHELIRLTTALYLLREEILACNKQQLNDPNY